MMSRFTPVQRRNFALTTALTVAAAALGSMAGYAVGPGLVSQKGRAFNPNHLQINRGEVVRIVNDDGDLRHHVYVSDDKYSFDSGDQEPGAIVGIPFPIAGEFEVLCAIHPKMKMIVKVK